MKIINRARRAAQSEDENEKTDEVWQKINELGDEHRHVIYLRFAGQLSYDDIAQTLGIPVGTVRSRLHRAIKVLQEGLRAS